MKQEIPFIVVHTGNQQYLSYAIQSIEKYHKVFLLGNEENKNITTTWCDIKNLDNLLIKDFDRNYIHMSSNSESFEKICFHRYIIMYEFAKRNNIKRMIHCDSDIIILEDCSVLLEKLNNYKAGCLIPNYQEKCRLTASPHFSYWTIEGLYEFIMFFMNEFKNKSQILFEKYAYHVENKLPGGVCDMTLLYLFYKKTTNIYNFCDDDNQVNFNISTIEIQGLRAKEILFSSPYKVNSGKLFYKSNDRDILVLCLHMQGKTKKLMRYAAKRRFNLLIIMVSLFNVLRKLKKYFNLWSV